MPSYDTRTKAAVLLERAAREIKSNKFDELAVTAEEILGTHEKGLEGALYILALRLNKAGKYQNSLPLLISILKQLGAGQGFSSSEKKCSNPDLWRKATQSWKEQIEEVAADAGPDAAIKHIWSALNNFRSGPEALDFKGVAYALFDKYAERIADTNLQGALELIKPIFEGNSNLVITEPIERKYKELAGRVRPVTDYAAKFVEEFHCD